MCVCVMCTGQPLKFRSFNNQLNTPTEYILYRNWMLRLNTHIKGVRTNDILHFCLLNYLITAIHWTKAIIYAASYGCLHNWVKYVYLCFFPSQRHRRHRRCALQFQQIKSIHTQDTDFYAYLCLYECCMCAVDKKKEERKRSEKTTTTTTKRKTLKHNQKCLQVLYMYVLNMWYKDAWGVTYIP